MADEQLTPAEEHSRFCHLAIRIVAIVSRVLLGLVIGSIGCRFASWWLFSTRVYPYGSTDYRDIARAATVQGLTILGGLLGAVLFGLPCLNVRTFALAIGGGLVAVSLLRLAAQLSIGETIPFVLVALGVFAPLAVAATLMNRAVRVHQADSGLARRSG